MATKTTTKPAFTKMQILSAEKYQNHIDIVSALLVDSKKYTLDEVDTMIDNFLKGKVE